MDTHSSRRPARIRNTCRPRLSRRHILSLLASLPLLAPGAGWCQNSAPPIRNILFLMGDDHSADVLRCYGNPIIRTPHLDQLATQGTRFNYAYTNSPLCTPSRQSILTGKLPHAAGVTLLNTPLAEAQLLSVVQLVMYITRGR